MKIEQINEIKQQNNMYFKAIAIINSTYDSLTGLEDREQSLADAHHVSHMFAHTVFANNFKMLVNKSKQEIENELDQLYNKAR